MGGRTCLYHCIGLSATPFGTNNDHVLREALGEEIYRYDYNSAAEDGVISPFTVCEVSASFLPKELQQYTELTDRVRFLLAKLLKTGRKTVRGRQTIA